MKEVKYVEITLVGGQRERCIMDVSDVIKTMNSKYVRSIDILTADPQLLF